MWKFEEQFRKDNPQTIGETDKHFDLDNYKDWLEKKVSQVEPEVMLKLADILQILDDEEYTVSVHSNDTIDDKISESIANTAIIDFKKQLKQELLSQNSA